MKRAVFVLSLLILLAACTSQFECPENHFQFEPNKCCTDFNNNQVCDADEVEPEPVVEQVEERIEEKVVVESPPEPEPIKQPEPSVKQQVKEEVPVSPPIKIKQDIVDETLNDYLNKINPPGEEYFYRVTLDGEFTPYYLIERVGDEFVLVFSEKYPEANDYFTIDTIVYNRKTKLVQATCVQTELCVGAGSYKNIYEDVNIVDFSKFSIEDALKPFRSVSVRSVTDTGLYEGRQVFEVVLVNGVSVTFDRIYNFPLKLVNPAGNDIILSDISFTGISSPLLPEYDPLQHRLKRYIAI